MNFLEKDLETIIWENPAYCYSRGLHLPTGGGMRWRQLNLAPYGVADLVYISISEGPTLSVTIIECKRDVVDLAAYGQACRYQTALSAYLPALCVNYDSLEFRRVLIGRQVSTKQEFLHILAADSNTDVYTYSYAYDGIQFQSLIPEVEAVMGNSLPANLDLPGLAELRALIEQQWNEEFDGLSDFRDAQDGQA
ncbi:MAG: hypothetical protein ACRYG7_14100 [Janthinobacterium lividum]